MKLLEVCAATAKDGSQVSKGLRAVMTVCKWGGMTRPFVQVLVHAHAATACTALPSAVPIPGDLLLELLLRHCKGSFHTF